MNKKKKKVLSSLEILIANNEKITKSSICEMSGVSKPFLYKYEKELLIPINMAIEKQGGVTNTHYSSKSQVILIASLKRKNDKILTENKKLITDNKKLREENESLKKENAILLGKLAQRM